MSVPGRPFAQLDLSELERLVRDTPDRRTTNAAILAELRHRTVPEAPALQDRLQRMLASDPVPTPRGFAPSPRPGAPPGPTSAEPPVDRDAVANAPEDILRAWTAMEVLSPTTFQKPEDLAAGDPRRVARLDRGLPWADGPAPVAKDKRLYFQIVLGSVVMQPAFERLIQVFEDSRPERVAVRGETPLAVLTVDGEGRPIAEANVVVSSFAWGLPQALAKNTRALGGWADEESRIQTALHARITREDEDGKPAPLDEAALRAAYAWLIGTFGLDAALVKPPAFAVRSEGDVTSSDLPEAVMLNSFFLRDLGKAVDLFREGQAPEVLRRYLGALPPGSRRDLLHDREAIAATVAPNRFPSGRWPGPGRHPLVLMQQAAVNLATAQGPGEILAVNGPPGTGKTMLLRDVVAALVTERATVMASFDDPEAAFTATRSTLHLGTAAHTLHRLAPRLRGFEMLVASSNNKAVENVSRELPAIGAIADDAPGLRYFAPMADGLLGAEGWGAIAAVLGNSTNRRTFQSRFWRNKDTGLSNYFSALTGRRPEVKQPDGTTRPPRLVSELDPPAGHDMALLRWQAARDRFQALNEQVAAIRARVEAFRRLHPHVPALDRAFRAVRAHGAERPGLGQRLLRPGCDRAWRAAHTPLSSALADAARRASEVVPLPPALAALLTRSPWLGPHAEARAAEIEALLLPLLAEWRRERDSRRAAIIDDEFFKAGGERIHPVSPWFTAEEHRARDGLFEAALDLHRAFIDAAARPMRQNLAVAVQMLDGKGLGDPAKDALMPDLWSSLFLVVPVLSTTFASVGAMLGRMPPASLGWLLVDEAGQAAPQQAVGALLRAERAIVVGDPIQVQPVVTMPERLTNALCRNFGIAAERFSAPSASVQTLADDASAWSAEFPARGGSRRVGVPLLVHRRCAEPMFGIANEIAYENLMVQAKGERPSAIRAPLGPSGWIDVAGAASDKWSAEEGREAVALIERIVTAGLTPDLYVVTPFKQVAERLRWMIRESATLKSGIAGLEDWSRTHVGTIHTVQGREAEAVIFVLGAPGLDQGGARAWAGQEPNLLNVALTRAKEVVYIVGHRRLWSSAGVFSSLARLPEMPRSGEAPPGRTPIAFPGQCKGCPEG